MRYVRQAAGSEGFTLIELLIVVVIIGILAAIAIPQFSSTKQEAMNAAAKSDLRNLMTSQEAYFYDFHEYATDLTTLRAETQFNESSEVTVSLNRVSPGVFQADAGHPQSPDCFRIQMGGTSDQEIEKVTGAGTGGGTCGG